MEHNTQQSADLSLRLPEMMYLVVDQLPLEAS
jgi:hypothetical protein